LENNNSGGMVENNINVNVNTGGNFVNNQTGEGIETGDYQIKVDVKNSVDGEDLEGVNINIDSKDSPAGYHKKIETASGTTEINVSVNDENTQVDVNSKIDGQKSVSPVKRVTGVFKTGFWATSDFFGNFFHNFFKFLFRK